MTRFCLSPDGDSIDLYTDDTVDNLRARMVPARVYVRTLRCWRFPLTPASVGHLVARFPNVEMPADVLAAAKRESSLYQRVRALKEPGAVGDEVAALMPVKATPYHHQVVAFAVALELLIG